MIWTETIVIKKTMIYLKMSKNKVWCKKVYKKVKLKTWITI